MIVHEASEVFAPILPQDCTTPFTIFRRPTIGPRVHFHYSFAFGTAISKDLPGPPAFKISTAPNGGMLDLSQFHRAVQPCATAPPRWPHIPVGMIVKRNEDDWLLDPPQPERAQMMKIAGTEK